MIPAQTEYAGTGNKEEFTVTVAQSFTALWTEATKHKHKKPPPDTGDGFLLIVFLLSRPAFYASPLLMNSTFTSTSWSGMTN